MATQLNLSECIATFTGKMHYEYPKRMQFLTATLTHPVHGELATARCLHVYDRRRFKNAADFLEVMDEESQELHEFSVGLFDKFSNIRPWLVDGGAKSGSGCWGAELSVGDILYVVDVRVKDDFRRRGVGSYLLQKVLENSSDKGHAFCWPTPVGPTADKADWLRKQAAFTDFYRKNGFRRVGLTPFLAYSPDPSHPSRKLPIACDPETPSTEFESTNPTPNLSPPELCAQYPLHHAIATINAPSVAPIILAAYNADAGRIHIRDLNGFMPVHVAASSENVHALRALLELGIEEDLKDRKNKDSLTPLEGLEILMRSSRESVETLLGMWKGYSDDALTCEYLLEKAMGLPVTETESEYIKQRKFGCTCGMCTDGWLSPRMRFQLLAQAEIQGDMLDMDLESFQPRVPLSASDLLHPALDYIPPLYRREIYKTFYLGFCTLFEATAQVLKVPGGIPTPQAVLRTAFEINPSAVSFYLGKGGKVEHVLDATVNIAKEQSSLGDGTFEDTFDCEEDEGEGYRELKKCANDLEFGSVRSGIGIGEVWGPYLDREEEQEGEEMEIDEYDDSDSD